MERVEATRSRKFDQIPAHWHRTIRVRYNENTRRRLLYQCLFKGCNATFDRGGNLVDHFRTHTKHRPFQCPICHKRFTQSGSLGRHQRKVHHLNQPLPVPTLIAFDPTNFLRQSDPQLYANLSLDRAADR